MTEQEKHSRLLRKITILTGEVGSIMRHLERIDRGRLMPPLKDLAAAPWLTDLWKKTSRLDTACDRAVELGLRARRLR